jgi:hypothetical protein
MPNQLQAASEAMERLLEPAHLAQISVIASMVVLGWWIARRIRRDLGAANAPAGWRGRAREAAWVAAPIGLTLLLLATADGLLMRSGRDYASWTSQSSSPDSCC